jgi:hypothetical protein
VAVGGDFRHVPIVGERLGLDPDRVSLDPLVEVLTYAISVRA